MIAVFDHEYAFLSNFYDSPFEVDGIKYPTVEHFFQAMKVTDPKDREVIAAAATPGQAKQLGRKVSLRADWEEIKIDIMKFALRCKFQVPELREKLLTTGDEELIEGNWWGDRFWGVCDGIGENHLGKLLMEVRQEIRENIK